MSMRSVLVTAIAMAVLVCSPRALAQAGGLILYENGTPDMGSSYAGAGARAQDAGTVFTNPAGMTRLEGNNIQLGTFAVMTDIELDLTLGTMSMPAGSFDGGGDLGQFAPGLGTYNAFSVTDDFKLGLALNVLSANGVEYDRSWVGRGFVIENQFVAANFQPTMAYRINDYLSVGAGLNVVYMSLDQELLTSNAIPAPSVEIDDADDIALGYTLGLMIEPQEGTRFGVVYREELKFNLDGDIDNIQGLPLNFDSEMRLPRGVNVSVYHKLNDRFAILADAGWSDWSVFNKMPTTIGPVGLNPNRGWEDTWRVGAGAEFALNESSRMRAGFSYDSSPIDDNLRLPDIPVGEQYRFSVGYQQDFGDGKIFGVSYTLMYSPMDVDNVALPSGVVLNGEYDPGLIHILGVSYSLQF